MWVVSYYMEVVVSRIYMYQRNLAINRKNNNNRNDIIKMNCTYYVMMHCMDKRKNKTTRL